MEAIALSGKPDAEKRSCYDCRHCKAALSWWCVNDRAVEDRGTSIPGVVGCKHWEPIRSINDLNWFQRTFGMFSYVGIECE